MSRGAWSPKESKLRLLLPNKKKERNETDTDIVSFAASVQYNCDVLHSTANPSKTPMPLIIVVKPDPSVEERLMFRSDTSLQNMYM